jgi:IS30 family transposase
MAFRSIGYETREEFFELLTGGAPVSVASAAVGVSREAGAGWWRKCGLVDLKLQMGAGGGLRGDGPVSCPAGPGRPAGACSGRRRVLSSEDRAVIAAGLARSLSLTEIGALIGRDKSVISREVARNRGSDGSYWGPVAHRAAHERRRRPKQFKLVANPDLGARISEWMDQGWSPGLIARVLAVEHGPYTASNMMARVSHETIYQALYVQTRGVLRADLYKQLSLKRRQRRPHSQAGRGTTRYAEAFTISQRPAEVADRAVPGHWEGDLIIGAASGSAVGTLVERSTRFTILLHLPGRHDADSVAEAMIAEMGKLPQHLRRSITWDRGVELMGYQKIQLALQAPVYFCDPHSPWQRGTNENTNRLLRFWLKKGTDLSVHTAQDLTRIAATLNRRPRPTLDLQTPADRLNQLLLTQAA